ncbi:FkbM family methyltransferase [Oricola nitratireducens]|uniref:FkbM family methyltransferase n=1 Tax=Oricola nitratireducens TaxID=2775868 RepID=UPI00186776BF|nr:FkbM family methyltransferase [Oricola nitratireducens]
MFEKQIRSLKRRYYFIQPKRRVRRNGIMYDINCRELIDYSIFLGSWEAETSDFIEKYVKDSFVTLEIGANVGAHTLLIAKNSGPTGIVHAVEPTKYARNKLLRNMDLNPDVAGRVRVHDLLISDVIEENTRREIRSSWPTRSYMASQPLETVPSLVTTIDRLVEEVELDRLDLIKIDIDGYDFRALRGAIDTIGRFRPLIYVELCEWAQQENGFSVTDIISFLASHGYNGYYASDMQPLTTSNVFELIGDKDSINGVFFPVEAKQPA